MFQFLESAPYWQGERVGVRAGFLVVAAFQVWNKPWGGHKTVTLVFGERSGEGGDYISMKSSAFCGSGGRPFRFRMSAITCIIND